MTTSVPTKTEEHALAEPPFPIIFVTDLLKAFVKAVRATQMYLPNNPMHARALDAVKEAFSALWHTRRAGASGRRDALIGKSHRPRRARTHQ
jgi:hypothetical protein